MNHKNKFCKNVFLSLIGSTAFKLSDLLTTFLLFRLSDNALMKATPCMVKKIENVLKFRQQMCLWNVLIVWWGTGKYFSQCFPINFNSFFVKIGEPLTKTSKLSTVSHRLSSLNFFSWTVLDQQIHFAAQTLKSSFNSLGAIMKCQKCSESETLHETGEVLRYAKNRMARSKTD